MSLISYLQRYYNYSRTVLCLKGKAIKCVHPTRGVKQGNPMSPILFNIAMEHVLKKLDRNIGVELEGTRLNHIAYADDVVLLAGTASGLQCLVDTFGIHAYKANLEVNTDKTLVTAIVAHGRIQKVSIGNPVIKYREKALTTMGVNSVTKYLGISFNSYGIVKTDLIMELNGMLERLRKSYLKPQQCLWVIKNCVFGRLAHKIPFI